MAIDPIVGAFEPNVAISLVAPARERRLRNLNLRVLVKIIGHRDHLDGLLIPVHFAEQEVEPIRTFEPPVAIQLRVIGRQDNRRAIHIAG